MRLFYAIFQGDLTPHDILPLIVKTYRFIADFQGEIPGASPKDCGNYLDMNLSMARLYAGHYLESVLLSKNISTEYPLA